MKREVYKNIWVVLCLSVVSLEASTFTDNQTNLMWQDDKSVKTTQKKWQGAIEHCQNLSLGGYSDWRLPTRMELHSITDKTKYDPAVKSGIKNVVSDNYWSSSPYVSDSSKAWYVYFKSGDGRWYDKSTATFVRCVRDSK